MNPLVHGPAMERNKWEYYDSIVKWNSFTKPN